MDTPPKLNSLFAVVVSVLFLHYLCYLFEIRLREQEVKTRTNETRKELFPYCISSTLPNELVKAARIVRTVSLHKPVSSNSEFTSASRITNIGWPGRSSTCEVVSGGDVQ